MRRMLPVLALLALTGCSSWMGEKEAPPLPGDRVSVLTFDQKLQADATLAASPLLLPEAAAPASWPFAGGSASHSGGHLALGSEIERQWRHDIGAGLSGERPLMASPVVADGVIYAMDSAADVTAYQADSGKELWSVRVAPSRLEDKATGGGLAIAQGRLVASVGYGEVVALDPANGQQIWRTAVPSPLRGSPTMDDSHVFVVTIDNQLAALDASDGRILWTHSGITEATGLLGAPSPAVGPGFVLVAYSSGELYALNSENGRVLWTDGLTGSRRDSGVSAIAAIRGMPALTPDGSVALALSNSGRMVAIDTRSGQRLWDQRIGGNQMPWIAAGTVFLVDNAAQLTALNLRNGRIRWITQLPQWTDAQARSGLVVWYGPVLAGGRLWLTNSLGRLFSFDPSDGHETGKILLNDPTSRPPLVAEGTLFTLDDDATLTAWR